MIIYFRFILIYTILNKINKALNIIKVPNIFIDKLKNSKNNIILINLLGLIKNIHIKLVKLDDLTNI